MLTNKHINAIIITIIIMATAACAVGIFQAKGEDVYLNRGYEELGYETELFDTSSVMTVNIIIEEAQWREMLDNALEEEYYSCDVQINGDVYENVGIKPKGNTSLTTIASEADNDRYSFKLEFDHFVEGQSCRGLDKLVLNNSYADNTNMKEAVVYDMYHYLDADASLYNYAKISVNGEYWGVYLALEAVEESFMERNYGIAAGKLYKPDSMEIGGNQIETERPEDFENTREGNIPDKLEIPEAANMPEGAGMPDNFEPPESGVAAEGIVPPKEIGMNEGMGGNSGGVELNYIDEELESYSLIWDGEVMDSSDEDNLRVVEALKNISGSDELEKYMDVENVIKYMAVHTFAVNLDSLSGAMAHNYYLYEQAGRLNIIPWDYNLAFGGFHGGDASSMINFPIDTPFSDGINMEDREFFAAILENDKYLEEYHRYLRLLCEEYVNGGRFDSMYNSIKSLIDELVEKDPTAMQTYEEYISASEMLYDVIKLRAESISAQLEGDIPSTTEGQKKEGVSLIDASYVDLSVMGGNGDMNRYGLGGGFAPGNMMMQSESVPVRDTGTDNAEPAMFGDAPHTPPTGSQGIQPAQP